MIKGALQKQMLTDMKNNYKGANRPKIDMHVHYVPQAYREALLANCGDDDPDGFPTPEWNPEMHLEFMQKLGISTTMLSITSPHINFGDAQAARILARKVNEDGAKLARKYPDKFGVLASLPLPDPEASLKEICYSMDVLHVDGFTLPTNTQGVYLGNSCLDPVFAALNERKAVVVLHPNKPSVIPDDVLEELPMPWMEFFFDTTRAVMNMMIKGTLRRYPDIRMVVPHAGAFLPILVDRVQSALQVMKIGQEEDLDIYASMRSLYFDVAGVCLPRQLAALLQLADDDHLLYGSDYPYTPEVGCIYLANALDQTNLLSEAQRRAIYYENAQRLFPQLNK